MWFQIARIARAECFPRLLAVSVAAELRIIAKIAANSRLLLTIAAGLVLCLRCAGASEPKVTRDPVGTAAPTCKNKLPNGCVPNSSDLKQARALYRRALRIEGAHPEDALQLFGQALQLVPVDPRYIAARERVLQELVYQAIERGNDRMNLHDSVGAATEFRRAIELDPRNEFALQRLVDATHTPTFTSLTHSDQSSETREFSLHPKSDLQSLQLKTDVRGAYLMIGSVFGIEIAFDDPLPNYPVRLDLRDVSFERAMGAVALITRTFWTPQSSRKVLVAADSPAKRNELERWLMRTLYLPEASSPQELTTASGLLRDLFEIKSITVSSRDQTITVRGPDRTVQAATEFLETLWAGRPQVMLDFEVYEISGQTLQNIGVIPPSQLTIFYIGSPEAVTAQISQSGSTTTTSQTTVPFNSVAIFGGGQSVIGTQIPPLTANFSHSGSIARSLSKLSLKASQGNATTFQLGTRYPVITSSYSGITSFGSAPSVTYLDLGVTVKATPIIHRENVTVAVSMEVSALGGAAFNGIPAVNQRQYSGTITVKNHEPAIIASEVSGSELLAVQGLPGLGRIKGLNLLTSNRNTESDQHELLIVITPHVLTAVPRGDGPTILLPSTY